MTATTHLWPLVVAAALALLITTATTPAPCRKTVPAYSSPPEILLCHYHPGSIEAHCVLLP